MSIRLADQAKSIREAARRSGLAGKSFGRIVGEHAHLKIHESNIHNRLSMDTCNRSVPFYVMSYMKEGSSILRCNGREHHVGAGEVLIVPPHTAHDHVMSRSRRSVFLWWHFDLLIGDSLDVLRFLREPTVFPIEGRERFEAQFQAYADMQRRPAGTLSAHIMRRAKSLELLSYLIEGIPVLNFVTDRFGDVPDHFISMLHDVLDDPATFRHVDALARRYDFHPSYVMGRFRHYFAVTPSRLGRSLLYEKASLLIRSRDISMEEIAFELGFSEPSSFTRFFKSMQGMSPSSLRKHGHVVEGPVGRA